MILKVVIFLAFIIGIMLVFFNYLRNKQIEREADRRERLQEKQEQLMESLRARKVKEENTED
ncbi:MAG: hypothetical protein J7621_03595 [Niastella sp.]|nr:hypothetical protein [Niastella sp.]